MRSRALLIVAVLAAAGSSALAQLNEITVQKFGLSGQRSIFGDFYALEVDCNPVDWIEVKIAQQPEHGSAELIERYIPASFPDNNPRKTCNGRPTRAKSLSYTPEADYKGPDLIRIETITSQGALGRITFRISVQ